MGTGRLAQSLVYMCTFVPMYGKRDGIEIVAGKKLAILPVHFRLPAWCGEGLESDDVDAVLVAFTETT